MLILNPLKKLNSASNSVFFDTQIEKIIKNYFFVYTVLALFANFEVKRARNGSKNQKTYFINKCVLELNFASMGPDF
jgi:hypothetical protein